MMGLPLGFALPWVLAALAVLPVLFWLLRLTPPPPTRETLPTLAIVRDMEAQQQTPAHTPWWLLLLRLLLAAAIILAMAGPIWNPNIAMRRSDGPLLIMLDNGWSAAPDWKLRTARAEALIQQAGAAGRTVVLRATSDDPVEITPAAATRASELLRGLQPAPHSVDRKRHEASVLGFLNTYATGSIAWISDGLSLEAADDTLSQITQKAGERLTLFGPEKPMQSALTNALNLPDAMTVKVLRAASGETAAGVLRATDNKGRPLGEARYLLGASAKDVTARFEMPLELRNEVSRIEIVGEASSGAVTLLDGRSKRRRVGVVNGESVDTTQPLLSQSYFILRALGPFADVREAPRGAPDPYGRLIDDGVSMIILAEIGSLAGNDLQRLTTFVENGGVLVRFASRRASAPTDALMPVKLRRSERVMGGALSWDRPKKLASFAANGPFDGLRMPTDVSVTQQILAEPDSALGQRAWAALEDGTPLITGDRRGKGHSVLYHVTADTGWSSLPFSGSFVETLRRLTMLSAQGGEAAAPSTPVALTPGATDVSTAILPPVSTLDGFGAMRAPPPTAEPIARSYAGAAVPRHPPGFYGTADAPVAVNTLTAQAALFQLPMGGANLLPLTARAAQDLRPHLLVLAVVLFIADALATLLLSGALARFRPRTAAAALLLGLGLALLPSANPAEAQTTAPNTSAPAATPADRIPTFRADDVEAALTTRLAFVMTGDREVDEISRQGLQGLSRALSTRTALDPGVPIGIDLSRDEMAYYPLVYWPMVAGRPLPSPASIRRVEAYMRNGGTVIFDTRDALNNRGGDSITPETRLMRQILAGIDVPDLEPIPKDHVITKTFYILESFVGRYANGRSWIEVIQRNAEQDRTRPAQAGDRVSPIIITGNDLAAAWAVDRLGQPRFPLVPGDARQREMAIRAGINIVMYTMTGNYKADQVHVPALLERLGQ